MQAATEVDIMLIPLCLTEMCCYMVQAVAAARRLAEGALMDTTKTLAASDKQLKVHTSD